MVDKISDEEAGPSETASNQDVTTMEIIEDDSSPPTPRFLQDESTYRRWKWIPTRLRRYSKAVANWSKGPSPPRRQHIRPWFPFIQEAPIRFLDTYVPKKRARIALVLFYYLCWGLTFGLTLHYSTFAADIEGYGTPAPVTCGATYWTSGNSCGLYGSLCRPFDHGSLAFRCPASCSSYKVLNPRAVGTQEIIYQPFVIGGTPSNSPNGTAVYRGDSFICQAAIHAGVINNANGGCGVVSKVGSSSSYIASLSNGIQSVGFDSHFPLSISFMQGISCTARDMRWPLLGISITFSTIFSLFVTSPALFFFTQFTALFTHVGLASDPPNHSTIPDLISNLLSKFLPAAFVAYVLYRYCIRRTLRGLTAQAEKTLLWLGGAWVGALTNYTFDFIPIQRLTPHDIAQQPGAKAALAILVLVIFVIVLQQIWYFRLEGRFLRYLSFYLLLLLGIAVCIALPTLNLRIHHYVLALLLLPGTSMQTRPSLLYQGILLGLFINGIARWGFDSVLQTDGALQGDAQHNSGLPPVLPPVVALGGAQERDRITFAWPTPPSPFDGVSVLVNDVERFRGYVGDELAGSAAAEAAPVNATLSFEWARERGRARPEYFRFAYMEGAVTWDYTKAGVWTEEGLWVEMEPGPSRVRRRRVEEEEERRV